MDPDGYTPEQRQLQRTVREFARREIAPGARDRDRTGQFDYALHRRIGEIGLPGLTFPAELGGAAAETLSFCLAIDEVSRVDLSIALTLWVGIQGGQTLLRASAHGNPEWIDQYVRPIVSGEMVGAGAITEPDAGSDTAAIRTRAVLDGNDWVIDGAKIYISNAGMENCAFVTPLCRTDQGFALFLVPKGTPGYRISPPLGKMGLRSADTRELSFDGCRVPASHMLGGRGSGRAAVVGAGFALTRIYIASNGVGLAAECLDLALAHARSRVAFKRPIAQFQHVQGMLVETAIELDAGRMLRDRAARLQVAGLPFTREAAMAKLYCTETAKRAADHAVQVFGAMGYMDEAPVSRYYRDVRALTIAEGTTEIQKHIIARELGCFDPA